MTKTDCPTAYSVWQDKVRAYRLFKGLAGNDESRSRWRANKASYLAEGRLRLGKCACYAEIKFTLTVHCILEPSLKTYLRQKLTLGTEKSGFFV